MQIEVENPGQFQFWEFNNKFFFHNTFEWLLLENLKSNKSVIENSNNNSFFSIIKNLVNSKFYLWKFDSKSLFTTPSVLLKSHLLVFKSDIYKDLLKELPFNFPLFFLSITHFLGYQSKHNKQKWRLQHS